MAETPLLADPLWLLLLPGLAVLAWRHHRRARLPDLVYSRLPGPLAERTRELAVGAWRVPLPAFLGSVLGRGLWRLHAPFYCRLGALGLLLLALARPQLGSSWEESLTEGIDIEIVLDVSGSMAAEDFQPKNRLAVAQEVVNDFIERRISDRLGLVIFSGSAVTRAPLTTDRRMLQRLVDEVELDSLPNGTAIGVALATAALRLKDSEADSRVVVLVTDGANNAGEVDPHSAAALCAGMGLKVYTIGVGTNERVKVPRTYVNPRTGRREVEQRTIQLEVDEELLQAIAERTGGAFYRATDGDALRRVFAEIDRLETTEIEVRTYHRSREIFAPVAAAALALLLLPLAAAGMGWTLEP